MPASDGTDGVERVLRVSAGHDDREAGLELLHAAREAEGESISVRETGSTGLVGLEPLVMATLDGRTGFVPRCDVEGVRRAVRTLDDGSLPEAVAWTVSHDPDRRTLPIPDDGPLAVGDRIALRRCGWTRPSNAADYGDVLAAAVESRVAFDRVVEAGLRGRGRGDASTDEPIGDGWKTAREAAGEPVVVVNANEADADAVADRLLLDGDPITVLDGALAAARAVDASDVIVYVNESHSFTLRRIQEAADALTVAIGSALDSEIHLATGPNEYKAGEETMALESLEGNDRIEARVRPPDPCEYGLYTRPTLVHTPRTFAQVTRALAEEDLEGTATDPGTRLVTVTGDVSTPATIELPTTADLAEALDAVDLEGGFKAACVGGVFGGLTRELNVPASAGGLRGARLGSNGVIEVLDDSRCVVALAGRRAKFAREENCGRCVPCREGSKQLVELLRDVYSGEFRDGMLRELARTVRETSLCSFGVEAARPVATALEAFETEFEAHAAGRCPSGACESTGQTPHRT